MMDSCKCQEIFSKTEPMFPSNFHTSGTAKNQSIPVYDCSLLFHTTIMICTISTFTHRKLSFFQAKYSENFNHWVLCCHNSGCHGWKVVQIVHVFLKMCH